MAKEVFITLKEAASLLGVTSTTLRNWDRIGKLRAVRNPVNNYRLYPLSQIAAKQKKESLFPIKEDPQHTQEHLSSKRPLTSSELRRLIRVLHRILRDNEGNSSLIERFDELTKIIYCKVYAERGVELETNNIFIIKQGEGRTETAQRIKTAFHKLASCRKDIFPDRFAKLRLRKDTIVQLTEALLTVRLSSSGDDLKGLAYEEIIKNIFEKGDNQQFFTPRMIVSFMLGFISKWFSGCICDPACGTGGFLLKAAQYLTDVKKKVKVSLLGFEIDERLAWVTRMNLDMHNVSNFDIVHIPESGSLGHTVLNYFNKIDIIITNPPFGSDLSDSKSLEKFKLGKGRTSRRRGVLFIERCLDLLKAGGILAIIIDDGVLNAPSNKDVRQMVLERAHPFAIISLPSHTFMPYASVKTSILFLQKHGGQHKKVGMNKKTFYGAAEEVGRKPNGDPLLRWNRILDRMELYSDLPTIQQLWEVGLLESAVGQTNNNSKAFWVELPDIGNNIFAKHGFRLDLAYHHPSRYKAVSALNSPKYPLKPLSDICELRNEVAIPSRDFEDEDITYVGLANIEAHTGVCTPVIVRGSSLKSSVKRFIRGDILFAKMRPELRKVCQTPDDTDEGFASSECLVLIPKKDIYTENPIVNPALLSILLRSDLAYGQLVHMVTGIGRPRISKTTILNIRLPVPPIDKQRRLLLTFQKSKGAADALRAESETASIKAESIITEAHRKLVSNMFENK